MGFWDKLKDASGEWADQQARKTDSMLDRVEKERAGRLNSEQQNKIAQARYDAERAREFAERRRQERETRNS
jgi:hypothetical protein